MWIRIEDLGTGQHPSEVVVGVRTSDGTVERVIVDRRSVEGGAIEIGYPVGSKDDSYLVELPRETMRGQWRVWMPRNDVLEGVPA